MDNQNTPLDFGADTTYSGFSSQTLFLARVAIYFGLGLSLYLITPNTDVFFLYTFSWLLILMGLIFNFGLNALPQKIQSSLNQFYVRPEIDLVLIWGIAYFSGGLSNPFSLLIIIPIIFAVFGNSFKRSIIFVLLSGFSVLYLAAFGSQLYSLSIFHIGIGILYTGALLSYLFFKAQEEMTRQSNALVATSQALAREQKISALGSLAAAAAHELGTPLGTITLAAREVLSDIEEDNIFREDISVIAQEAVRCREILERLSATHADEREDHLYRLPIEAILQQVIDNHSLGDKKVSLKIMPQEDESFEQPLVTNRSEIIHGLGNFIENAVGFATETVEVVSSWSDETIRVSIIDDGPGFDHSLLPILGQPYISTRGGTDTEVLENSGGAGGLGLGVFIAKTLIERTGGEVSFGNSMVGGAQIDVTWPRSVFEEEGEGWQGHIKQKDTWNIFEE